jgi:hypothetical protein
MRSTNIQLAKSPRTGLAHLFDELGLQRRSFALNAVLERAALYAYADKRLVFGTQHIFESMLNALDEEQSRFLPTVRACGMDLSDFNFNGDLSRHEAAALQVGEQERYLKPDHGASRVLRLAKSLAAKSGEPAIDTVHVFRAMLEDKGHRGSKELNQWMDSSNVTQSALIATSRRLNAWQCSLDTLPMTQLGHADLKRGFPPLAINVGGKTTDATRIAKQRRLGIIGGGFTPKLELFTPLGLDVTRWYVLSQCFQFFIGIVLVLGVVETIRSGHPWWVIFGLILAVWDTTSTHWSVTWIFRLVSLVVLFLGGLYPWLGLVAVVPCYFALNTWLTILIQRRETRNPDYDRELMAEDRLWAALGSFPSKSQ